MDVLGLAAFALIILVFAVLLLVTQKRGPRALGKEIEALKARRGWRIAVRLESLGKGRRITVRPATGEDWSLVITRYVSPETASSVLTSEFRMTPGTRPRACFVIGPPLSGAEVQMVAGMFGACGIGGTVLPALIGPEDAEGFGTLAPVAPQDAGFDDGTVFAAPGAGIAPVLAALADPLRAWRRTHRVDKMYPIVLRGPHDLRLRLRQDLDSAQEIEGFADLALSVAAKLQAAEAA